MKIFPKKKEENLWKKELVSNAFFVRKTPEVILDGIVIEREHMLGMMITVVTLMVSGKLNLLFL